MKTMGFRQQIKVLLITFSSIIFFTANICFCQIYPSQNYSVREGLVHSSVFSIVQDHSGYIWFATENGISRFDGVTFKNYTLKNLGITSYISSIYVDEKNDLYLGTATHGIYKYFQKNEKIIQINNTTISPSNQILIKNDLLISMQENRGLDFISISSGLFTAIDTVLLVQDNNNKILSMEMLHDRKIILGRSDGLYEFLNGQQIKLKIKGLGTTPIYSIYENKDSSIFAGGNGVIYKIKGTQLIDSMRVFSGTESRVRNIITDNDNNIWFNIWGTNGIYMIDGKEIINVTEKIALKNVSVSRILKDKEGNIWIGTLGKGVYMFSNMFIHNYPPSNENFGSNIKKIILTSNHKLLLGTNDGIALLDPALKTIWYGKQMPEISQYVRDIAYAGKNRYLFAITDTKLDIPLDKSLFIPGEHYKLFYAHASSIFCNNSELWVGNWDNSYFKYDINNFKFKSKSNSLFYDPSNRIRINCFFKDPYNRIWIGGQKGVYINEVDSTKITIDDELKNDEIFKFIQSKDNHLIVVTNTGFLVLKNDIDPKKIRAIKKMSVANTTCVVEIGKNEYLVGTQSGLYILRGTKKTQLSINDGLPGESINDILYNDNLKEAWVATSEGMMQFELDKYLKQASVVHKIDEFVLKQDTSIFINPYNLKLPYSENTFFLTFHSFFYNNPSSIIYRYKIDNGDWEKAPSSELQFASLDPGSHIIRVSASNSIFSWGPVRELNVEIIPPYYRTLWFYLFSTCILCFFLIVMFKKRLKYVKNKQEEKALTKQKIVELQQKALASNLNPHFIFNSLNSIQHFINSHNPADANDYLAKFSRLMRLQLNMADKSFITLHEEISRIEFYLSLEQMRFSEKLTYQITVDPEIDQYTFEIPNMIIQPFIENSIWHGIMPSNKSGNIHLSIKLQLNNDLEIIVADNGVGYGNSKKVGDSNHESKGIKLISDRLNLLDPDSKTFIAYESDLNGTVVKITLKPKMYHSKSQKDTIPQ